MKFATQEISKMIKINDKNLLIFIVILIINISSTSSFDPNEKSVKIWNNCTETEALNSTNHNNDCEYHSYNLQQQTIVTNTNNHRGSNKNSNNFKQKKKNLKKIKNKYKNNRNKNRNVKRFKSEFNKPSIMMDDDSGSNNAAVQQQQQHKLGSRGQRQHKLNKNALRLLSGGGTPIDNLEDGGAFPALFNIAPRAKILVNATCGQNGREEYCKLVDAYPHQAWATQCGICNSYSSDLDKHYPIEKILDNNNLNDNWWQSPTLRNGHQYEYVTIILDLRQIYQIFFVMLKAANSPRPASWILEKSFDNITYYPWQYFGLSDADCRRRFNIPGQTGKYIFQTDDEVICTTQFSKALPLENGEIHVSLLKNRPGAQEQSPELLQFISARFIRIRLQGLHSTANIDNSVDWLLDAESLEKRSFYSFKQIRVSGRLNCHGHANRTYEAYDDDDEITTSLQCSCIHNTCGKFCDHCCPLHQMKPFRLGTFRSRNLCTKCQCHGHADRCLYDENISSGICQNCTNNTQGKNCETCESGYYRPMNSSLNLPCEKCDCNSVGIIEPCDPIDGKCKCREGFVGEKCEFCAQGFYGEYCLQCACDKRGTIAGGECEEFCQCKQFVEGANCSQCALGYFGLRNDNPEGCQKCYCSGVGLSCKSAQIQLSSFETLDGWQVTDLSKSIFAYPIFDNLTDSLLFGMYDLPGVESFYWLAPEGYLGNKLTSYGTKFVLKLSWVVIRGDTSGKPTTGPNIILFGRNGIKIAHGDDDFQTSNAVITIELNEAGWYHVPKSVKDIVTRMRRDEYHGDSVTRAHFMSVLSNLEAVLIRGRFHTDQVESILDRATLYAGDDEILDENNNEQGFIEECLCPPGHIGLSCEECGFGYIRVFENSSNVLEHAKCVPCPCNGHAETCDLESGKCGECQHNTYGERCERCKVGFYGNPMQQTPDDCKRCACPLEIDSNNFSPNCQKLSVDMNQFGKFQGDDLGYICTQCPIGSTGDHCEMCDDGYFGNPMIPGSYCKPCECDGGPCDILTGECIKCHGNSEGWRCDRCKAGYWGDPEQGCEPCDCHELGSTTNICDLNTGQCLCKLHFTGIKCNQCNLGFANLNCEPCQCNVNGSTNQFCDPLNGQCNCKLGVSGLQCDLCDDGYFGLADNGCEDCFCSTIGSASRSCDRRSGQCLCHLNVIGRRCDQCNTGNWNLTVGLGCQDCECDNLGSLNDECDPWTGQCNCKHGIGGRRCNQCLEGHYGFSNLGCVRCEACQSNGHVCDPVNGRCICPPNSRGPECVQCQPGTWGWKQKIGCEKCECNVAGSIGQTCNILSGECICREGYAGRRCDSCAIGYFGYPDCRRCNCNVDGSFIRPDGLIECDSNGQCPCKELAIGLKCDTCVHSTFGLNRNNPEGCTKCFCFGRSHDCQQSVLSWGHIRMPNSRNLSVQYVHPVTIPNKEYEYIVVVQMEGSDMYREDAEIGQINGLNLIPSSMGNVSIGAYTRFYYPLYFQLPPQFYGDKTNSYGGFLRFSVYTEGCTMQLDQKILFSYPLVQIHSHNKLVIDFYDTEIRESQLNETYSVPLHEYYWKFHHNRQDVNRAVMMAALQNIKYIFLRGTSWADFQNVILNHVVMDSAIYVSGSTNIIAYGVEQCSCPHQYDGLSCQDPGTGYYRWKNSTETIEYVYLEEIIGISIPCDCNGRSQTCDPETGACLNCRDNSGGHNCESCAEGFYGEPNYNGCMPCPCPETSKNFARGCTVWNSEVNCVCKHGYTGPLCDRCRPGYFGHPQANYGSCEICNCNKDGIVAEGCDAETGQCYCRPGVIGRQCDICEARMHFLEDRHCKVCDNCTLILRDYIDSIAHKLRRGIAHMDLTGIPAPWLNLGEYDARIDKNTKKLHDVIMTREKLDNFDGTAIEKLVSYAENTKIRWRKLNGTATKRDIRAGHLRADADTIYSSIGTIRNGIYQTMFELANYGSHNHHISLPMALEQARYFLNEIKIHADSAIGMRDTWHCAYENLYYFGNASDLVFDQTVRIEMLWRNLNTTNRNFADMLRLTDNTLDILHETDDIQEHIINTKIFLQETNENSNEIINEISKYLNNNFVPETEVYLDMIDGNNAQILANIQSFRTLHQLWNDSNIENDQLRRNIIKHWIPKAWRHSNRLMDRSNDYARQFQPTKDGAKVAILASSAHEDIVNAINAAGEAAIEAKQRVFASNDKLYPTDRNSVINQAQQSLERSKSLQRDALSEMTKIKHLKMDLKTHEDKVDSIKSIIWHAGIKNNNISASLDSLNNNSGMKSVWDSMDSTGKIADEMRVEGRKAVDIKSDISKLRQKFATLEPEWDTKLGLAEENISQTLSNIRSVNNSLNNVENHHRKADEKFQKWNDTMCKELQELKDKIAKARHAAEGIKVSLESLDPKCIRSYVNHNYGLTTSNTIKLSLALKNRNGNSPLIYMQGNARTFIALELYRRKIRLIWNLGGQTAIVTHPLEIQVRDPKYDDAWYHIEANRTLNVGSLLVRRMTNNGILAAANSVVGYSDLQFTRFHQSQSDRIWLGGVPHELRGKDLQNVGGLNVVVHQLYIDNYQLGLWNFAHSEGECGGAMLGAQESTASSNARHFNGLGYSVVRKLRPRPYRKNLFALQMTFKTLDDNACLFVAIDEKNNCTVSVFLKHGRIVFKIIYKEIAKMEIISNEKYNIGKWIKIEVAREFSAKRGTENGILRINNDAPITGKPAMPVTLDILPDLSESAYILGGLPPGFRREIIEDKELENSFLGCMTDVAINGETYDPLESSSFYGVEQSCKQIVAQAAFNGNGYVELSSQSLRKRANVAFVFRTLQPDCLLLLSAYPADVEIVSPSASDSKEMRGNYSISLIDGRLHVWIDSGRSSVQIISNQTVNDGEFHVVNVIKTGRRIEVWIDDELEGMKSLTGSPNLINMPKDLGGLYLGGAPDYFEYTSLSPTLIGLQGTLKDLVFNNRSIAFSDALKFVNVQIGRAGPQIDVLHGMSDILMKTQPIEKTPAINTISEGCHKHENFSYEPNAYKYGDSQISYSQLNVSVRNFWQKNFYINFDLRTFYPNGILIISPGTKEKPKHYISLILKDGHLTLIVRGRRREELTLTAKLNNGEWHHVSIHCQERKVTMSVNIGGTDQKTSVQMKIPKKISASNVLLIGGLPENSIKLPSELLMRLEGFKGCIRQLEINNKTQDLAKDKKHLNVGQCLTKIEKGSYFTGDSYATYKKNFHVGKYLELEIDFKTSELNGVLLVVSEPTGFPALSLEVYQGNVILSCDLGDGNPFRVESLLPSKYAICDNKWHNISALYDFEQISLRVDNNAATVALAQHRVSGKIQTKSPLYIGGLPAVAPSGTLYSRSNFKGCIRNVSIRNERRDWIDMDYLHNVLLNECLAI